MNNEKIIMNLTRNVSIKVREVINVFPSLPSFDHSYWKGYCNAIEEINGIQRNAIYNHVLNIANIYCEKLRMKNRRTAK